MSVKDLLAAKDWAGLAKHFAATEPGTAQDFQARALLALSDRSKPMDWPRVLSDLRQACALEPGDALLKANLSQALLEARQPEAAWQAGREAVQLNPTLYPAIEKLALAAMATGRFDEAFQALQHAETHMPQGQKLPQAGAALLSQLKLQWWRPVGAGGVVLRKPVPGDLAWLGAHFQDAQFMRQYHRLEATAGPAAVRKFIELTQASPFQSRRIDWIVQDRAGRPRGLAALVDIDWPHRRCELVLGFREPAPSFMVAGAAAAALGTAFQRVGVQKVVSTVLADNPRAQAAALHMGFVAEGRLRGHALVNGARVDLLVNGLMADEYRGNELLKKLAQRWRAQYGRVME